MKRHINWLLEKSQGWVDRWWFPAFISLQAFVDVFLLVIPSDGIMISSVFLRPKKWIRIAIAMTIGSTLAGTLLAFLIHWYGQDVIMTLMPSVTELWMWKWTQDFFEHYGLIVVFLAAVSPFSFQPAIFFAVVSGGDLREVLAMLLVGRTIKNSVICYLSSHAPLLMKKFMPS